MPEFDNCAVIFLTELLRGGRDVPGRTSAERLGSLKSKQFAIRASGFDYSIREQGKIVTAVDFEARFGDQIGKRLLTVS